MEYTEWFSYVQGKTFLGFDCSTQSLKCTIIDETQKIVYSNSINFGKELSRFNTNNGIVKGEDGSITSPTIMWVAAFDLLLNKMKQDNVDFSSISGITTSAQQHGSVFWNEGSSELLKSLNSKLSLEDQMKNAFSFKNSPIWMDATTTNECKHLEKDIGGYNKLASITGSRAYERFTGNQIARLYNLNPDLYTKTERISLVSSFVISIFTGHYCSIDTSDGAGMNLLDIHTKEWDQNCLDLCAPNLKEKLGRPALPWSIAGTISSYFSQRYGFNESCLVITGTGDNQSSLVGIQLLEENQIGVSLGTSNTFFANSCNPQPDAEGHIFPSPLDKSLYMCMLCYKNGDFVRSDINNACCLGNWAEFSYSLSHSKPGNENYIVMKFNEPEITPHIPESQLCIWDDSDTPVSIPLSTDFEYYRNILIRGIIEYQFMSMRIHSEHFHLNNPKSIIVTGGASSNKEILQVLADVFNCSIYTLEQSDSASLGASYRAYHAYINEKITPNQLSFAVLSSYFHKNDLKLAVTPNIDAYNTYTSLLYRYRKHEQELTTTLDDE